MDANNLQKLKDAFNGWAANHDRPHMPAIFIGAKSLTPRQYADEVINETAFGRSVIEYSERVMKETGQSIEAHCAWINPPKAPKP